VANRSIRRTRPARVSASSTRASSTRWAFRSSRAAISALTIVGGQLVAIVNRSFVTQVSCESRSARRALRLGYPVVNPQREAMIIGVVEDVRQRALNEPAQPAFYSS
jgi:hypothetical protein